MSNIAVMGGGAWGTALALNLAQRGGHSITLWTHSSAVAQTIRVNRENTAFLPGFHLPNSIATTSSAAEALAQAEAELGERLVVGVEVLALHPPVLPACVDTVTG